MPDELDIWMKGGDFPTFEVARQNRVNGQRRDLAQSRKIDGLLRAVKPASSLDGVPLKPVPWIVPGVIVAGYSVFCGAPKSGKTFLASDIALAVASGGRVLDAIDVQQRPVLYLAMEDTEETFARRLRMVWGPDPLPDDLVYLTSERLLDIQGNLMALLAGLKDERNIQLVIADTLETMARPKTGPGVGIKDAEYEFGVSWQQFTTKNDISVLALRHESKGADRTKDMNAISAAAGTSGVTAAAEGVAWLHRDPKNPEVGIFEGTTRVGENYKIGLHRSGGCWQATEGVPVFREASAQMAPRTLKIIERVQELGQITLNDLTDLFPNANTASVTCRRLVSSGHLVRVAPGAFELAPNRRLKVIHSPVTWGYDTSDTDDMDDDDD